MTRRDFQMISATLARVRANSPASLLFQDAADRHAYALADVLATTNPKFDRRRFLAASGVRP